MKAVASTYFLVCSSEEQKKRKTAEEIKMTTIAFIQKKIFIPHFCRKM